MDYLHSLEWLHSRGLFSVKLGLERITDLMNKLRRPKFKAIHIAGTNGKGSVAAMIASILRENDKKVGLYTSPHLVDIRERIRISNKLISKEEFAKLASKIKPLVTDHTFFEILTAMAFVYFKDVDYAVIETGLGGRLDATNIINPDVSVITNVSIDHTAYLGSTIKEITMEKAGIIKDGVPVVTISGRSLDVIKDVCLDKGCKLIIAREDHMQLSLKGEFQKKNAAIAVETAKILGITPGRIKQGLIKTKWPGRMDLVQDGLMFDCAHNPAAVEALCAEIDKEIVLVLGIMKDKNIKEMCESFNKLKGDKIVTKPDVERAADPAYIAQYLDGEIIDDIPSALKQAQKIANGRLIVLTGSIFAVGEAYTALSLKPFDS